MNKNTNNAVKSWKSSQQGHKATNSLIIQNYYKTIHHHPSPIIVQVKNMPQSQPIVNKQNTIQRHYSQQDFRKYYKVPEQNYVVQSSAKVEDEYFPDCSSPGYKNSKAIRSIEKTTKPTYFNIHNKNPMQNTNYRINNVNTGFNSGLKETSSTQSAQNLMRPIPNYVRSKIIKTKTNQYFNQRLSTPRSNNLRRQNFRIISKLGQGKFGKVFMVKQVYTGFILAMKIVQKKKILQQSFLQQFIRQLKIQSFLSHPNIISLYGFFSDQTHFYTLMQLGCDGQLYSLISNKKILTQQATSFIVKNLLQAINYIHANKVLHRDIKPENIVIIMGNVKICDFGWAANKLHPGELRNTFCGTPLYLSPEILQGNRYDQKVDLWAIGILAFQLYLGCSPFDINDQTDLIKITTDSIKFPQGKQTSIEFKQFISSMLTKNPNERLTSRKLLQMDFITKYKDFQTCQQLCK